MIVRGTTPYHKFLVPMSSQDIDTIYITYLQNGEIVLDKTGEDVSVEDVDIETENAHMEDYEIEPSESSQVTLHLTQEDTLKFKFYPAAEKNIAVIQLRILTSEGEAYASDPIHERIFGVLKEGEI